MKKRHIILIIAVAVLAIGFIVVRGVVSKYEKDLKQLETLVITDVDLQAIQDGDYPGSYSAGPVAAEVSVAVKDHSIQAVKLIKHSHGQGKGAEVIPQQVVEAQSVEIDTISGATYSSKVILKAIETALSGAGK